MIRYALVAALLAAPSPVVVNTHDGLGETPARTYALTLSHGRAAFADDSGDFGVGYVRDVAAGTETGLGEADSASVSGPFVASMKTYSGVSAVFYRHGDGPAQLDYVGEMLEHVEVSGHRMLATSPDISGALTSALLPPTQPIRAVPHPVSAVFGDHLVTVDKNGGVHLRNLLTNGYASVRAGTCGGDCGGLVRRRWRIAMWGDEVVYALDLGSRGRVAARWNRVTKQTTALPMLAGGWTEISFRDGLLLAERPGSGVRLWDLDTGATALVDAGGRLPRGRGLDGTYVAWESSAHDLRAVAAPITDFLPSYVPVTRHLNASVPPGFGPGIPDRETWRPRWWLSEDSPWTLAITRAGAPVETLTGTTTYGEVAPEWDGEGEPAGWYDWSLTTEAGTRTGRVFLSRDALPTPEVFLPTLVSDASATGRFDVRWSGAPSGTRYAVYRSRDDGPLALVASTTATSMTVTATKPYTYTFEVYVEDPAGRRSAPARSLTVTPHDDVAAPHRAGWTRVYHDRMWRGSMLTTTTAGESLTYTAAGTAVWVVGARGPSYGKLRVTVDGVSYTVDTWSQGTSYRRRLFRLDDLADTQHTVTVTVLPTAGRTRLGIDGVAFRAV